MKLAIGTAQFGIPYGISNKKGQTSIEEIKKTLKIAKQNSIKFLDTAPVYGESEQILGNLLKEDTHFQIITKTIHFNNSNIISNKYNQLEENINNSLNRLQKKSLYGILIHNTNDFLTPSGHSLFKVLSKLKNQGLIKKIGFSVYSSKQIDAILKKFKFDLIQLPINILDQRILAGEHLTKLKKAGIEIHARSIFLQGLLLMPFEELPQYFKPMAKHLKKYFSTLKEKKISSLETTLNFVKNIKEIDQIIIGINNSNQLLENIKAYNKKISLPWEEFAYFNKEEMLDPQNWRL